RATRPLVAVAALPNVTLVALASLVGCVLVTVTATGEPRYPAAALVPAAAAALSDIATGRIPERRVALTACPPVAAVLAGSPRSATVTSVLLGAAAMAVPMLVVHLVDPDAIGFGDVKLGAALGAALGVLDATTALA